MNLKSTMLKLINDPKPAFYSIVYNYNILLKIFNPE